MLALGLNSGSSFDGIDAVLVDIDIGKDGLLKRPRFIAGKIRRLAEARCRSGAGGSSRTSSRSSNYAGSNYITGALYAEAARSLMRETRTAPEFLSVIGFDGQTVYQEPADPSRMAAFTSTRISSAGG